MIVETIERTEVKETRGVLSSLLKPETYHPIKKFFQAVGRTVKEYFPHPVAAGILGAGAFLAGNFFVAGSSEASGIVAGTVGFTLGFIGGVAFSGSDRETIYKSTD